MKKKMMIIFAILIVVSFIAIGKFSKSEKVEAYTVDKGNVENYVDEIGTFSAKNEYLINSKVTGEIKEILKFEGDEVKKGDIIVKIDSSDIELKINSLKAEIDGIYSEIASVSKVDSEKISQLKSQIEIAQNDYYEKKDYYDNSTALFEQGAISKTEMDTIERMYKDSESRLSIAKDAFSLQTKGISKELREVYDNQIESLGYNLKILENSFDDCIIKAPVDGIITDRFVDIGRVVSLGSSIIEISDPSEYIVKSDILVGDSVKIDVKSEVLIKDPESEQTWEGEISRVYPKAFNKASDLGIEQKRVKIEVMPYNMEFLKYGYEFDLKIIFERKENVFRVKDNCIFKISGEDYVFLVDKNKLILQNIIIGLEGEDYVEVVEGLKEGDIVVSSPGNSLEEGMKVEIE